MELSSCKIKFKMLFEMFFKENFELSSYYAENLLNYLEDQSDKRENIIDTPFFSDLIIHSIMNIGETSESVRLFIIKIMHIMVRNELQFSKFSNLQGIDLAAKKLFLVEKNDKSIMSSPALQITGVKLCAAMLTHSTGLNKHIEMKVWEKYLSNNKFPKSSIFEAELHKFIAQFVWKLNDYKIEPVLVELLNFLVSPIKNNPILTNAKAEGIQVFNNTEEENATYAPIVTRIKILLLILSDTEHIFRKNFVVPLLINYLMIEPAIGMLSEAVRDPELRQLLLQTSFRLNLATYSSRDTNIIDIQQRVVLNYCNYAAVFIEKRQFESAIQFSADCIIFWSKLDHEKIQSKFERHGRTYEVQNQFLIGILTPILASSTYLHHLKHSNVDSLSIFYNKLNGLFTEQVIKTAYLLKTTDDYRFDSNRAVIEAAKQVYKIIKHLNAFQAVIVYQTLFYVLQNFVVTDENGALTVGESPIKCPVDIKLFSYVLDLIKIILKEHNIKWYDSVEIISLQTCLMNIVKQNLLPKKQLLQALDLIDLTIKKFLSPDLVLLMESRRGNTINEIIAISKCLIEQPQWELRDSALHIVLSCTELAFIHYVPMQKLLQENNLMTLVTHTALFDEETYVQATALRCLAAATKIGCLWNLITQKYTNIHGQLMHLLNTNHEDIVRKEAVNVLSELCAHTSVPICLSNCLYNVMTTTAVEDLDWEVQLMALNFWKNAIKNILSYRGMMYNKFPTATFCKERRKIITLNEPMVKQQIVKILNDLAKIGCLKVLNKCLNAEQNIQVLEKAHNIAKSLMSILDLYKFESVPENMLEFVDEQNIDFIMIDSTETSEDLTLKLVHQEQIIEEILNISHSCLIQNMCNNNKQVVTEHYSTDEIVFIPVKKWLNPNEFITDFRKTDYEAIIAEKKNWNTYPKSLDTLLAELLMLGEIKKEIIEECD